MLTSKAWRRRLAKKSSALGIASTLVLFTGTFLTTTAAPAQAAAMGTKQFAYTCTGGPFTNTSLSVGLTAPDTTPSTAGTTFDATFNIPALTIAQNSIPTTATTVQVTGALTVTGGSVSDAGAKPGAQVAAGAVTAIAGDVKYKVAVTTGQTGKVSLKPGELKLSLGTATGSVTTCTLPTTSTDTVDVTIGTGGGTGDDIIAYDCALSTASGTDTDYPADVDIKVTLTMPTAAKANEDASITWTGVVQSTGDTLKVPAAGLPTGSKFFATVKASGAGAPATATGEAALTATTAGATITPPTVTIKVRPTTTGTVTITPAELAIGTTATSPAIKCLVATGTTPKTSTFTVTAGTGTTPTPTPTPTPTATPKPTTTRTVIVTKTPVGGNTGKVTKTPKAGAETGGGGDMGPDGRMFVLVGTVLIAGAGVGGLMMRRRTASRG